MQVVVLGAGLVGGAIVKDLAADGAFEVTAVDADRRALDALAGVRTVQADVRETAALPALVAGAGLVVCAVPGALGFATLRALIEAGVDVVDISFFPEDPFELDGLARDRGVTAVVDCGVAPGLCNVIAGHHRRRLDHLDRYLCHVGGLPQARRLPYEYKAVFSPSDVIEEYTRPARLVERGEPVVRAALSEVELLEFPGVGTLEAFNTDGLRTLLRTLGAPFMAEKTLRYPGHAALMRTLRDSGFFSQAPLELDGQTVVPRALTSRLLFAQWRLEPGEADLTAMQVVVEGVSGGARVRHTARLLDRFDPRTGVHSMARTTGYTCTAAVRLLAEGGFRQRGICPPEWLGEADGGLAFIEARLAERGIVLEHAVERL